jgi:hypothetical protein
MMTRLIVRDAALTLVILCFVLGLAAGQETQGKPPDQTTSDLTPLPFPPRDDSEAFRPFSFAAMGDSRGALRQVNTEVLTHLAQDCRTRDPNVAFLVFVGDMGRGSTDPAVAGRALHEWRQIMAQNLAIPVCLVKGNHDAASVESEGLTRRLFEGVPRNGPADEQPFAYYFDTHGCRLIMLDTNVVGHPYEVRDLDWLEGVLKDARARGIAYVFVFGHVPAYPTGGHLKDSLTNVEQKILTGTAEYLEHTRRFWDLLIRYRASAYVCGHEHLYSRQDIRGVCQIVTGGGGAPLYAPNPARPGPDATESQRQAFEEARPYYEHLGYPHGPGEIPQAGQRFRAISKYHYCVFDVRAGGVTVRAFGADPAKNAAGMAKIELIDEFEIPAAKEMPGQSTP